MAATVEEEAEKTEEEDRDEDDEEEGVGEGEKRAVAGSPAKQRKRALKQQSERPESGNKHDAEEAKRVYSSSLFAKLLNKQLFGEFVRQMDPGIKVAPDAYEQLNEGVDSFFKSVCQDLATFAANDQRRTINTKDAVDMLHKHNVVDGTNRTVSDIAHEHLPMELVAEVIPVAKANNVITRTRPSVRQRSSRSGLHEVL